MHVPSLRSSSVSFVLVVATTALPAQAPVATHAVVRTIPITAGKEPAMLKTFCTDAKGNLLVACGGSETVESGGLFAKPVVRTQPKQIRVFTPEGKNTANWDLDFLPQAVHATADGKVWVGGEGRLVVLDAEGKKVAETTLGAPAAKGKRAAKPTFTGIAVGGKDVFAAVSARTGTGYEVWRCGLDLAEPKVVLQDQRGCCGQFDIQVRGEELVVADNCKHRVTRYDRDGKEVGGFGEKTREGAASAGFGGCCNPMNTCVGSKGEIYTAESEGLIKCFDADGKMLALVAQFELKGGCKHVALEVGADGNRIYVIDEPSAAIVVLERKGKAL